MEETLEFNKRMIEDLKKKNLSITNDLQKCKEIIEEMTVKNFRIHEEN